MYIVCAGRGGWRAVNSVTFSEVRITSQSCDSPIPLPLYTRYIHTFVFSQMVKLESRAYSNAHVNGEGKLRFPTYHYWISDCRILCLGCDALCIVSHVVVIRALYICSPSLISCYSRAVRTEHELRGHFSHLPHSQGPVCHQTLRDLQHDRGM